MKDSRKRRGMLASHNKNLQQKFNKKDIIYQLGSSCSRNTSCNSVNIMSWNRTSLMQGLREYAMYIVHLFLLLCILQQNHQTKKARTAQRE